MTTKILHECNNCGYVFEDPVGILSMDNIGLGEREIFEHAVCPNCKESDFRTGSECSMKGCSEFAVDYYCKMHKREIERQLTHMCKIFGPDAISEIYEIIREGFECGEDPIPDD